jgi:hypothetical protein
MSGWVAGTRQSSGLGRFMLPCRIRPPAPGPPASKASANSRLPPDASSAAAVGLLWPLFDGDAAERSAVTSRAAIALSSTCTASKLSVNEVERRELPEKISGWTHPIGCLEVKKVVLAVGHFHAFQIPDRNLEHK